MKIYGIDEIIKNMYILKPFYGYILYKIKRSWDSRIPTACVDIHRNLRVNKEFFDKLNMQNKMAVIEHEVLHLALLHIPRFYIYMKDPLYKDIASIAMDCTINQLLTFKIVSQKINLGGKEDTDMVDSFVSLSSVEKMVGKKLEPLMNAEYYFREMLNKRDEIMEKLKNNSNLKDMIDQIGQGHDKMFSESVDENGNIDPLTESVMRQLLQSAKEKQDNHDREAGVGSGDYFTKIFPTYISVDKNVWKRLINKTIGNEPSSDKDYIFGKISRRKENCYWGYKHQLVNNKVYIGIDTSGSTQGEQEQFIGVVAKSLKTQGMSATIIQCDWDIQDVAHNVSRISLNKQYTSKGGGGTDLTKILDYIEKAEKGKKARLVLLTDGYTPWRNSDSVITTCIYTKEHDKLDHIMYSAILEK